MSTAGRDRSPPPRRCGLAPSGLDNAEYGTSSSPAIAGEDELFRFRLAGTERFGGIPGPNTNNARLLRWDLNHRVPRIGR
jgi:hypothetical protein